MLSVTFMTDIPGLFAIVLCLYGCLRALQARTDRATIAWLCFAVLTNALCGTSRQIAWLGILAMLPSTLWLLRARRRVFVTGAAATLAGALFILASVHWFALQPYSIPEHLFFSTLPVAHTLWQLADAFLDIPFLLLPIAAVFLPQLRKSPPRILALLSLLFAAYLFLALYPSHLRGSFQFEPTMGDWVCWHGIYESSYLKGAPPLFLHQAARLLLTIAAFGGLLGLIASLTQFPSAQSHAPAIPAGTAPSWKHLGILLAPFTLVYTLLLIPRAATYFLVDRYLLGLLLVALLCLVRFYQDRVAPRLPLASILLVAIMAIYGIAVTHNNFAFYRARIALADELRADGVPDTSVDNGWEYNLGTELQHADHINDSRITIPARAYVSVPKPVLATCSWAFDYFPHIHALYGVAFQPNVCNGPAPFAPVHYSRWPYRTPGTLYVVRYTPPTKP
jgi:hypothetical protein